MNNVIKINKVVRDRELMRILSKIERLEFNMLSESQIMAFKDQIKRAENKCKWLCSSSKAGNLVRKLDRELFKRMRDQRREWESYWRAS